MLISVFFCFVRGPPRVLRFLNINQKFGRTRTMKIEYKFVTGEDVSIEVYGEFEEIMLELDRNLKNNDRKETRRHESLDLFDKDERNSDITVDILGDVCRNFDKDKLYDAIAKLKPQEQELIHKLYLDKNPMTQAEYARNINISDAAMWKKIQRIRDKIKRLI